MKFVILLFVVFSATLASAQYLPESCQDLGGIIVGEVTSTAVNDLDQGQSECVFNVAVHHGNSRIDYNCPIDLYAVEQATYVDYSCSVKVGDVINHSGTQKFSSRDMTSRGLFYWIELGGYQSHLVFPNYGK